MERRARTHDGNPSPERRRKELTEGIVVHVVIHDFACRLMHVHVIRRIRQQHIGLPAIHQPSDLLRDGAVTAHKPMPPKQPDVAAFRPWCLRKDGTVVVLLYLRILVDIKTDSRKIKQTAQVVKLSFERGEIPVGKLRRLVVRQRVGSALFVRQVVEPDARYISHAEFLGSDKPTMTLHNGSTITPNTDGIIKAESTDGLNDCFDILLCVFSGVPFSRFQ